MRYVFLSSIFVFLFFPYKALANPINEIYESGVIPSEELVWHCTKCNLNEMQLIFGKDWNKTPFFEQINKERKLKLRIENIKNFENQLQIFYSLWIWTNNSFATTSNYENYYIFPSNPLIFKSDFNFTNNLPFIPFLFPVPVDDYIGELDLQLWYDIDNRVLPTINVDLKRDLLAPNFPTKNVKIIAIYNNNGILSSYKIYLPGFLVILEIYLVGSSELILPASIAYISIVMGVILIYLINEKRNIKRLKEKD